MTTEENQPTPQPDTGKAVAKTADKQSEKSQVAKSEGGQIEKTETSKSDVKNEPKTESKKEVKDGDKPKGEKRGKKGGGRMNQVKKENAEQKGIRPRRDTWSSRDVKISRALAGILKHGMMGFEPDEIGYLYIEDIAAHHHFKEVLKVTADDLKRISADMEDRKGHKQFELTEEKKDEKVLWKVRSNKDKGDEEITVKKAAEYIACIHGTYWKAWEDMKQKGISRLGRNHIHFSSGMLGKDGVVSGIRPNCEVLVYIDLGAVVREGIKFFRGEDGVLWSDGNKQGLIPPKYFLYAVHISPTTGQQIYNEDLSELRGEGEAMEKNKDRRPNSSMSRGEGGRGGRGSGRGRGGRGGGGRGAGRGGRGGGRGGHNRGQGDTKVEDVEKKENEVDKDGFQKPRSRNRRYRGNKPDANIGSKQTGYKQTGNKPAGSDTKEQMTEAKVQVEVKNDAKSE